MDPRRTIGALATLLVVTATACGSDTGTSGSAPDRSGVIEITMADNAFSPDRVTVEAGEEVTFRFRNEGELRHEALLGTAEEQAEHEAEMAGDTEDDHGGGAGHGDERTGAVTVEPGDTGELSHRFEGDGELLVGCHEPGHWEAGMKLTVTVG